MDDRVTPQNEVLMSVFSAKASGSTVLIAVATEVLSNITLSIAQIVINFFFISFLLHNSSAYNRKILTTITLTLNMKGLAQWPSA
jgi:hypothetical protein